MARDLKDIELTKGILLLAEPFLHEMSFRRAVILLADHGNDGSVGFILNKPIAMKLDEVMEDFPEIEVPLYYGGPVATETLHYVHDAGPILDGSMEISKGVYWGGDFEKLKFLIQTEVIKPRNIRFFLGYSGWSDGQLAAELASGSWIKAEMDPNYTFQLNYKTLWESALNHKGDVYSVIAQIPDSLILN